jgi:predicted XRE-type DNA-binding protein
LRKHNLKSKAGRKKAAHAVAARLDEAGVNAEVGSDNIFEDLGFSAEEAAVLELKHAVFRMVQEQVKGMTQIEASERLGIRRSQYQNMLNGTFKGLSMDRMLMVAMQAEKTNDITKVLSRAAKHLKRRETAA